MLQRPEGRLLQGLRGVSANTISVVGLRSYSDKNGKKKTVPMGLCSQLDLLSCKMKLTKPLCQCHVVSLSCQKLKSQLPYGHSRLSRLRRADALYNNEGQQLINNKARLGGLAEARVVRQTHAKIKMTGPEQ